MGIFSGALPRPASLQGLVPENQFRAAQKLTLRGKSKEELAVLAGRYLPTEEVGETDRVRLIEAVSHAASNNDTKSRWTLDIPGDPKGHTYRQN
jgi:hypothetical protein